MARLGRRQSTNVVYVDNLTISAGVTGDAAIAGSGTIAATGAYVRTGIVAITGSGTVTASSSIASSAAIVGAGVLAATGRRTARATATIAGVGTINASTRINQTGTATIAGAGTLFIIGAVSVTAPPPVPIVIPVGPRTLTPLFVFIAEDIMTGQIKTQSLELNDWTYDDTLNRSGSLQGQVSLTSDSATEEILDPWRTAIYVAREGRIEWGGILLPPTLSVGVSTLSVSCFGWLGYWDRRIIRTLGIQYVRAEQFAIFLSLVNAAQSEVSWGAGFDLGIGVVWDAPSSVLRDRSYYDYETKNLGEALRELAAVEDGFDYAMTYTVNTDTDRIEKAIKLFYPHKGRTTNFVYEYERDAKTNVLARGFADPVEFAWAGDGWGSGSEHARLKKLYVDTGLRGVYPPYESAPTWASVTTQATLDELTASTFGRKNRPLRIPILSVDPDAYPRWGDVEIGDTIGVRIIDGYGSTPGSVPQQLRITGTKVTANNEYSFVLADPILEDVVVNA